MVLNQGDAMRIAAAWYTSHGPFRMQYRMLPLAAAQVGAAPLAADAGLEPAAPGDPPSQWAVRFRVEPETGFTYLRVFSFEQSDEGMWRVHSWATDPAHPDSE